MLKNYVRIALRNFRRRRFYTFINVFGLAIGLASSLLIGWYVIDELSYDHFHRDAERVFRVITYEDEQWRLATTPPPLYEVIKKDIPEVEAVARVFTWNHSTMRLPEAEDAGQQKVFRETSIYIADPEFLQVLDFNLVAGEVETALTAPSSLVLTKATAERYFGTGAVERGDVLGKEILFGGSRTARRVSGVVDPQAATHFPFDMLVSTEGYHEFTNTDNWVWNIMYTYVKVQPEVIADASRMAAFEKKIRRIAEQYVRPFAETDELDASEKFTLEYRLQAVADIHLHSDLQREHQANGSSTTVSILALVALLIILLACINFMNLSTAQATRRAKEVGVRKALGSPRTQLILQFLVESVAVSLVAMLLALGLVEALRMPFNALVGKQLSFNWFEHPTLLLWIAGGVGLVGLLAGSYPAFYLSSFRPTTVLRGSSSASPGAGYLRSALIVFQFAVSVSLIITTALVVQQLRFIQQKDVGYDREHVLVIRNDKEIQDRWQEFKAALQKQSAIQAVSFATEVPSQPMRTVRDFWVEETSANQGIAWVLADPDYVSALKLEIVTGRNFQEDIASDRTDGLLLNEAAVRALALDDPVGKTIVKNRGENDEQRLRVIGVVKNFNVESFDQPVKPMAFHYFSPSFITDYVVVRLASSQAASGIAQVASVWTQFEPDNPLVYSFLDEDFDHLFRAEQRLAGVLSVFTGLAILIACLGLLGLVALVTTQRTKEVGIRKVLGASVVQIMHLLSRDFLRLVVIALVVATPLSYWVAQQWLNRFAYRIHIGVEVFVLAGVGALLIAGLTVGVQSVRTALANPVDALRDE